MTRRMRTLAAIGLGIVVLFVCGAWIFVASIDWNRYRGQIEEAARELTGREVRIEGDLRPSFSLEPVIVANGVTLANAPWGSDPEMVRVGRLDIAIRLTPLLSGQVDVRRLVLHDVRALLETDGEGRGNWELDLGEREEVEDAGDATVVFVRQVLVDGAQISYRDGETGETVTMQVESLSFRPRDATRQILEFEGRYEGEPIRLTAVINVEDADNEAVFTLELTTVNQVSATRALLGYMAGQMVADLNRLAPPRGD